MYRISGIGPQRGVGNPTIKSTPLLVNGILYFTIPDHVFAVNARTGEQHLAIRFRGPRRAPGRTIAAWACTANWLYFLAPDGWFISLEAKDGKERWRKKVADEKLQYFTTMAPLVVKNHVIVGWAAMRWTCADIWMRAIRKRASLQWRWWSEPQKPGDPGADTWPNKAAMDHGGGMTWLPGTYDPELNLTVLGNRQRQSCFCGPEPKGRESMDRVDRRAESGHGQAGLVVPGIAARHSRLGQRRDAGVVRRRDRREAA